MGYADDVNVMGRSMQGVKETMEVLDEVGKEVGLTLNATKTKILIQSKKNIDKTEIIKIGNKQINMVDKFKYLGVTLTDKNEEMAEIQCRIQNANKTCYPILSLI